MGDNNDSTGQKGMNRRKFLAGVGAAGAASVAGCTGGDGGDTPTPRVETVIQEETVVREQTVRVTDSPTPTPREGGGESSSLLFNAMGYTGADDLIDEQAAMMSAKERQPIVKEVLATIWNDAPTNVMFYDKLLNPVTTDWVGWIPTVGGPTNSDSFLNLTKADGSSGGQPNIGMDTAPSNLNILATSSSYSFQLLDNLYTAGTGLHPTTFEFIPAGYESWELNVDNVGTDSPTLTATMRDDLLFNDGTPVTAEDAKFTVEYIKEQEPAGSISASQFSNVEEVTVDDPEGRTVNYFLSAKDNAWFTSILGQIFLPQHIWSNVSDYQKYTPRNSSEGIVGSGPFELTDFSWGNWFELSLRDEGVWQGDADYIDYLDDGAPFVDGVRYELLGSQTAVEQAVLDGSADGIFTGSGVSVDVAIEAQRADGVEVIESEADGWSHTSWNTRRVPFDDRAFRQFLVRMYDSDWIIEEEKQGIGGRAGSYVTPFAYNEWRPDEPWNTDSHGGIPLPSLPFPGNSGTFQLDSDQISAVRKWLVAHQDAKHNYSWQDANVDGAASPDGKVLHVNGEPFNQAHTNNFGEPGQGPLQVSFNPPQEDVDEARIQQRWVGALKTVGVPVATQVQSFNSQIPKVYGQENFDVFSMGWGGININNDHYKQLFGSAGADLGY